jgi:hypothetical protein
MNRKFENRWINPAKEGLNNRIHEVVPKLLPAAVFDGKHYRVGDVQGNKGQSMVVYMSGEKKGRFRDYTTDDHGDMIDLWMLTKGTTGFAEAREEIEEFLGTKEVKTKPTPSKRTKARENTLTAEQFYSGCTLADRDIDLILRYFVSRCLHIPVSFIYDFRMMISRQWGIELVTPIHTPQGAIVQVSRIALNPDGTRALEQDGRKKPKKKYGSWLGDCGTLVERGPHLKIFEGLEDSVAWSYKHRDDSILICYGAGGFKRVAGFLTGGE